MEAFAIFFAIIVGLHIIGITQWTWEIRNLLREIKQIMEDKNNPSDIGT